MSIESRLVDIRTYLEDIASTQRQLLAELQRQATPAAFEWDTARDAFVGTLETEPPPAASNMLRDNVPPWAKYDDMTVSEVLAKAALVEDGARAYALAYERKNKNRTGVIQPLVNWNS